MFVAIITLTLLGVVSGVGLAVASKKFSVAKDGRTAEVLEALPGINCGACGYPGCAAMADAIVAGKALPSGCPVSTAEAVEAIGRIMGIEVTAGVKLVARLLCGGDKTSCPPVAEYNGPMDCGIMAGLAGGGKPCVYGCMGGGSCVAACKYNAMRMDENGLPVVIEENCISCGLCVKACPRGLMKLLPVDKPVLVACSSHDKGPVVRKICSKGCIACRICVKSCPVQAPAVNNFLSAIDTNKCSLHKICVEKCPTKAIIDLKSIR